MQGEFGLGDASKKEKVTPLDWAAKVGSFKQVASGNQWHAYLTQGGEPYVSGHNSSDQIGLDNATQVKTAELHVWYKKKARCAW